jgi:hypothetical protein
MNLFSSVGTTTTTAPWCATSCASEPKAIASSRFAITFSAQTCLPTCVRSWDAVAIDRLSVLAARQVTRPIRRLSRRLRQYAVPLFVVILHRLR